MAPGFKLAIGGAIIGGVTLYMAYIGASSSWKYYLTSDECVQRAADFTGGRMRVSGKVLAGSLHIAPDRRQARFSLRGQHEILPVACTGALPDNLSEDMEVVVEGRLEQGPLLCGDKVLTRCASKYESEDTAAGTVSAGVTDG
jgi:cytochrome c-type biogenesis protein CcmE